MLNPYFAINLESGFLKETRFLIKILDFILLLFVSRLATNKFVSRLKLNLLHLRQVSMSVRQVFMSVRQVFMSVRQVFMSVRQVFMLMRQTHLYVR
jgi:hypothetical protein